jgi:cytoskeletal protein CcmA (bactofilin family)
MFGNKDRPNDPTTPTAPTNAPSRRNTSQDEITAYLGPDVLIEGTLRFEQSVLIEGQVKGDIHSDNGVLVIGEKAKVEANIHAGAVTVRGHVAGTITATQRVHLQSKGTLIGELTTPSLQMDENVTFDGSCSMPRKGATPKNKTNHHQKNSADDIVKAVESVTV